MTMAYATILAEWEPMPPTLITAFEGFQQAAEKFWPASSIWDTSSPNGEAYKTF